jgi:hypothetical protein
MNIALAASDSAVAGNVVVRIVVGDEIIEFLDQPFAIGYDAETNTTETEFLTNSNFLLAKLAEVWNLSVEVPQEATPPDLGVEKVPNIVWPTTKDGTVLIEEEEGPTVTVKISHAIRALGALADMIRAGTLPPPPPPAP